MQQRGALSSLGLDSGAPRGPRTRAVAVCRHGLLRPGVLGTWGSPGPQPPQRVPFPRRPSWRTPTQSGSPSAARALGLAATAWSSRVCPVVPPRARGAAGQEPGGAAALGRAPSAFAGLQARAGPPVRTGSGEGSVRGQTQCVLWLGLGAQRAVTSASPSPACVPCPPPRVDTRGPEEPGLRRPQRRPRLARPASHCPGLGACDRASWACSVSFEGGHLACHLARPHLTLLSTQTAVWTRGPEPFLPQKLPQSRGRTRRPSPLERLSSRENAEQKAELPGPPSSVSSHTQGRGGTEPKRQLHTQVSRKGQKRQVVADPGPGPRTLQAAPDSRPRPQPQTERGKANSRVISVLP